MKSILITGGSGSIGLSLTKLLLENNYNVIFLKRKSSKISSFNESNNITFYDIEEKSNLDRIFNNHINCIVHLATQYYDGSNSLIDIHNTNTTLGLNLLEKAIFHKVPSFINIDTTLFENLNPYTLSKKYFSKMGKILANDNKIRFINMPLHLMYGASLDSSKFTTLVIQNCLNNVKEICLTGGNQIRDFIHINDVVESILHIIGLIDDLTIGYHDLPIGTGKKLSLKEFIEKAHSKTNSKTKLLFGSIPYRKNEPMSIYLNDSKMKDLGWSSKIEIDSGIEQTIKEIKNYLN